jgi:hypothetical protein
MSAHMQANTEEIGCLYGEMVSYWGYWVFIRVKLIMSYCMALSYTYHRTQENHKNISLDCDFLGWDFKYVAR